MIACVYVPHVIAALHQRAESLPDEVPLAVFEAESRTRQVVSLSPEGAIAGARIGMTLKQAEVHCEDLIALPLNRLMIQRKLDALLETLSVFTPQAELEIREKGRKKTTKQAAITGDEDAAVVYLDLGKLREEEGYEAAQSILEASRTELQVEGAIALSSGKFTSRVVATSLLPREMTVVRPGEEGAILASYPTTLLPIYPEEAWRLFLLGLHTLGELATLPASAMLEFFGKQGRRFHQLAKGRDTSPVLIYEPIQKEYAVHQFEPPLEEMDVLERVVSSLVEDITLRLERKGQVAQQIQLALTPQAGASRSAEIILQQPSGSPTHLTRTSLDLLASLPLSGRIVEVEILFGNIRVAQARQLSLFELEGTPYDRLRGVLRNLIARHGVNSFYRVELADPEAVLLDWGFQLKEWDGS